MDDWFRQEGYRSISIKRYGGSNESIVCSLCTYHNGSMINSSDQQGNNVGDAMQKAVMVIEQTIGADWRVGLPVIVAPDPPIPTEIGGQSGN